MPAPASALLETVLRQIAQAAPNAWYPSSFVRATEIPANELDLVLEKLRLAGLIRLTDWTQDGERGYALTIQGLHAVQNVQDLVVLQDGKPLHAHGRPPAAYRDPALRERAEAVRKALLGPSKPFVTWLLLLANIAVFLVGLKLGLDEGAKMKDFYLGSPVKVLEQTGYVSGSHILQGQWWRLLSNCFVHIGLLHLFVNMFSLFAVGPLLERMWGHLRFLVLYLIAGFGGSCALLIENPIGGGAGASGALWGIVASMAAWLFLNRKVLPRALIADWRRQLVFVLLLNVAITFSVRQISKGAHFGGGLVGLLVAVPLHYQRYGRGWQRGLALVGIIAVPVLCFAALAETRKRDDRWKLLVQEKETLGAAKDYLRQVEAVEVAARKDFAEYVKPLFDHHPKRRPPAKLQDAHQVLAKHQPKLRETADLVAKAGPHQTPELEETRQAAQEYLEGQARFFELSEKYLKEEKPDDETWQQEYERVAALRTRWRELLKKNRPPPAAR